MPPECTQSTKNGYDPSDVDREITIRDYLDVAWSGRWLILVTTVLGIIVGLLVSVAHSGSYNAVAKVYLGQPTSVNGAPLQSPLTSAQTAVNALDMTALSASTAQALGLPVSDVNGHVHVAPPIGVSTTGSAPPTLNVTATNAHSARAVAIANQFAKAVVTDTGAAEVQVLQTFATTAAEAQTQITLLRAQIKALAGSTGTNASNSVAVSTDATLLSSAETNLTDANTALAKAQQTEVPRVLAPAYTAAASTTAPKRLESVALAGLVGFLIGLVATFIWRGSPGGRASGGSRVSQFPTDTNPQASHP